MEIINSLNEQCNSKFWDLNTTWNTEYPDFTICFEKTILVWIPCAFLWICLPLEIYYLRHSKAFNIPFNLYNITKLGLFFGLTVANIKLGIRSSGILFLFSFLLVLFGAPEYRTQLIEKNEARNEDSRPRIITYPIPKNVCPENESSFLSKLLFTWFDKFAWKGYKKPLETSDLWNLDYNNTSATVGGKFEKFWISTLEKSKKIPDVRFRVINGEIPRSDREEMNVEYKALKSNEIASILSPLRIIFGGSFLFGAFLKIIQDSLTFVSPQVLSLLIDFVNGNEPVWRGYLYVFLLFIVAVLQTLLLSQYFHRMSIIGLQIRTALVSIIYKKALRISNGAKRNFTTGEIINLMSVDAQRFIELMAYINMLWSAPFQIVLALYFLWQILGKSNLTLAGLAVMIILIPVNGYVASKIKNLQIKQMKSKDNRVKLMSEILSGIKVLKLYAWEPSFEKQILHIRNKEIKILKNQAYLNACTSFIWSCAPFLVSLVTFAVYVLSSDENILDEKTAFVSLSLFNILRFPLSMLPMLISNLVQTSVSVKRINKFLNSEELNPKAVYHENKQEPLIIENGTFSWEGYDSSPILNNINVKINSGNLVAVVGPVGSGKSSLISAFLGEMYKHSGFVNTKGTVAYVPQQAWIQNATFKDNITFGGKINDSIYSQVLDACALNADLEILPGHDQTEIGEKGINLSGGQKQRISLARAVCFDSDIYFLDDPLSAVDSHVGKHIFNHVIGPNGLLKRKTRILVTHSVTYLSQVDFIVVLKNGCISESGTFKELLERKGDFADFLLTYLKENVDEPDEEDLDKLKEILGEKKIVENIVRQRSKSSESESVHSFDRQRSNSEVDNIQKKKQIPNDIIGKKLIETERVETGNVKWNVFVYYLASVGAFLTGATIIMNFAFQGFSIGANMWLSLWSSESNAIHNNATGKSETTFYLGIYGLLGLCQVVSVLLSSLFQASGMIAATKYLHWYMLTHTLRAPLSFFDTTPTGRIVNRFGKDIDTLDNVLPHIIRSWLACLFGSFLIKFLFMGTLKASSELHKMLVKKVFHWPLSLFDITPLGRIVNRFGYDINILDNNLVMNFRQILQSVATVCVSISFLTFAFGIGVCIADILIRLGCWKSAKYLHNTMLHNIVRTSSSFTDVTPVGRILSRFSKDIDILDNILPSHFSDLIYCFGEVVSTLFVISYSTPIFMTVIIPVGGLYYFVQRFYVSTSRQLKRLESVSRSPIYSHFGETVAGVQSIRAYGLQQKFIEESENKVDFNQKSYYPIIVSNRWLSVRLETVGNVIILFAALFAVLGRGSLTAGLVGLSVSYALQITQSLNWLVRMTSEVETNIVAVERIKEYGETPQEAPWEIQNESVPADWPEKGDISFIDFKIRYREGLELVLKGINFSVNGGEKVILKRFIQSLGRTGAGKSSLTLGLFRIMESASGKIVLDGIDISTLGLHTLRSRITIIPQDPVLFSGTLRINLDPVGSYSDEQVWHALELAHLKSYVSSLNFGLQYEVEEGGQNFSIGQRQLICLARALLRKTKVLVLDEATAAIDLETDDLIQSTIRSEFRNSTVLTIAHRLNTIMDYDRIVVLEKGIIVEYNSPQELIRNKHSVFYGMASDAGLV
ncbi:hypothetical protein PGB90_010294 [Kerria lacca]